MTYCEFLTALFADGRVIVPTLSPLEPAEIQAGDVVIADYERLNRLEMPGVPPDFAAAAGRWAGTRFFRACQFLVYRDVGQEMIDAELGVPYGASGLPSVHYSVDLVFRFLPDAAKLARAAAEQDPLLIHLNRWAREWPLSSVGMPGLNDIDIIEFESDLSLMQLYVDRIISKHDTSRLDHQRTRDSIRSAIGMFPELADKLSSALRQNDEFQRADETSLIEPPRRNDLEPSERNE